ncbi:MAG: RNA-binding S4 domain-containing protein [Clostridia bacterium]|nr:RNA-binding S4 domain-containing protein [Clostridia bacterium]
MRLDKFLKVSRIIKRRTLAKEVCDHGKTQINNRVAKAGTEVKPGDVLELDFGYKKITVEVLATPENVRAQEAKELYKLIEEKVNE